MRSGRWEIIPAVAVPGINGNLVEAGTAQVTPWLIDYKRFNDPKRNRFFATPPEIEHKVG